MADNEQQMVLVAKLVDQVSDKLKEINKAMLATEGVARKAYKEGAEGAEKHRKQVELLAKSFDQIKEAGAELVKPAFLGLGLSAFSLAGAVGAVVEAVKSLGEQGLVLEKVHNRTGMMADSIRQIQGLGQRWGVSIEETNAGLSQFGDMLAQTNRLAPQALRQWMQMPGAFELLGSKLKGLNSKEAFDRTMDFVVRMPRMDQRRRLLAMLGLPADLANFTKETLAEARHEEEEWTKNHPFAEETAKRADENFTKLGRAFQGLKDDLGAAFGGPVLDGVEAINHFLENKENIESIKAGFREFSDVIQTDITDLKEIIQLLKDMWNWAPAEWMRKTPKELLDDADKNAERTKRGAVIPFMAKPNGLYHPSSFGGIGKRTGFGSKEFPLVGGDGFSAETEQHVEDPIYRGTLHALQDWYQQLQSQTAHGGGSGGGGGGGFMNANFGGSGGAAHESIGGDKFEDTGSATPTGQGAMIDREKWRRELDANPALKERFFRHTLGENSGMLANQAVMEEAANRAGIRGNKHFADHSNLSYFQGYYRGAINSKMRKMLEENYRKVFVDGSDVSHGAIDNSSGGLAAKHDRTGRFKAVFRSNGETFQIPGWGESGAGERAHYPEFRRAQLEEAARRRAALTPSAGPRTTDGGLLKDQQTFNDRWNDRIKGGEASVTVDFKNAPPWLKTAAEHNGMFKEFKVNRGTQMPRADEGH